MADLLSAMVAGSKEWAEPVAAAYAEGNRRLRVIITRPGTEVSYDRDTGFTNPDDTEVYDGPARMWPVGWGSTLNAGDEVIEATSARISINEDVDVAPRVDDLVHIFDDAESRKVHVAGRDFTVVGVEVGGHFGIGYHLDLVGAEPSRRTQ